ncbi:MAG: NAD(+)--rifampin ADP-ribosyltransferase [Taibaiella sp.]|nr:NAD(+)--rifampin ADP-ribosyltransferase [Taibaiella sp.]
MEFNPQSKSTRLLLQGMAKEGNAGDGEVADIYRQAWDAAANDLEKFIVAQYIARIERSVPDRLKWYETAVQLGQRVDSVATRSAFPSLYGRIADCYDELGDEANAQKYRSLSETYSGDPADPGPFYHGTRADLKVGDELVPGFNSNYKDNLLMNHIYFTAMVNGAGLAASLAKGDGRERVYVVEPTGSFENDPNVTDKKFPGNLTRSYRTTQPLKIVGEVPEWARQTPEDLQKWRERLADNQGEIIN